MSPVYKILFLQSLLLACTAFYSYAQTTHYWSGDEPIPLFVDRTSAMVHLSGTVEEQTLLNKLQAHGDVASAEYFPIRKQALIRFKTAQSASAMESVRHLVSDGFTLRSAHYGYQLRDGFTMWLTHQIVFKMKPGVDWFLLMPYLKDTPSRIYDEAYGNIRYELDDLDQLISVANAIEKSGLVKYCHPDFYAPVTRTQDPMFNEQFQMHNTGQTIDGIPGVDDIDIDAPEAWGITTGDPSIIVSMIDDGVENHEDLNTPSGTSRLIGGYTPATGGNGSPTGTNPHGMACTGIVGASHNNMGVRGVAPQSRFLSVNIFAGGETSADIAMGFNWSVANGAAVISNSWGYTSCSLDIPVLSDAINTALTEGRNGKGCVVVFASGNGSKMCVDYPAKLPGVIAVGAVTNQGVRSSYSNYGYDLDLVAPSSGAARVRTTDRMGLPGYSSGNYTNSFGGTSAACPVVSGVAALVLAVNADLTGAQVKGILEGTADDMGPEGFDTEYAYGRVNAYQAIICAQNGGADCKAVPPPPPPPGYCFSQGTYFNEEWISKVTFGSFSQSSGQSGYSDFTNLVIDVEGGTTYDVSVTPAFSGTLFSEFFRIWIDYNQDLDFDDAGELVFSQGPSSTTVNGTVTIPVTALSGETRMRVSMKWNTVPSPCEVFAFGEVEDYTIKVGGEVEPVICDTPTNLSTSGVSNAGATCSWSAVAGASDYSIRYRKVGGNSYTTKNGISSTSYSLTGLDPATEYEWSVRTNCANELLSDWSSDIQFTTPAVEPPPPGEYCAAYGENSSQEWIDLIKVTNLNNASGNDGGYKDFTGMSANLVLGVNTKINFSKGSPNVDWGYWRIYIDWNGDGDFNDVGEMVVNGRSKSNGNLTASFKVPLDAKIGATRMRAMLKYGDYPNSCETYARGEVEDYTVVVASNFNDNEAVTHGVTTGSVEVTPNPASDVAMMTIETDRPILEVFLADFNGRVLREFSPRAGIQEIQLADLPAGVYLVVVRTDERPFVKRLVIAH